MHGYCKAKITRRRHQPSSETSLRRITGELVCVEPAAQLNARLYTAPSNHSWVDTHKIFCGIPRFKLVGKHGRYKHKTDKDDKRDPCTFL